MRRWLPYRGHVGRFAILGAVNGAVVGFAVLAANVVSYTYLSNRLARAIVGFEDYARIYWPVVSSTAEVRVWVIWCSVAVLLMFLATGWLLRGVNRPWLTALFVTFAVAFAASSFGAAVILVVGEVVLGPDPIFLILTILLTLSLSAFGALATWYLVRYFNRPKADVPDSPTATP